MGKLYIDLFTTLDGVAQAPGIFDRREAGMAGDGDGDRPAGRDEFGEEGGGVFAGRGGPFDRLRDRCPGRGGPFDRLGDRCSGR